MSIICKRTVLKHISFIRTLDVGWWPCGTDIFNFIDFLSLASFSCLSHKSRTSIISQTDFAGNEKCQPLFSWHNCYHYKNTKKRTYSNNDLIILVRQTGLSSQYYCNISKTPQHQHWIHYHCRWFTTTITHHIYIDGFGKQFNIEIFQTLAFLTPWTST